MHIFLKSYGICFLFHLFHFFFCLFIINQVKLCLSLIDFLTSSSTDLVDHKNLLRRNECFATIFINICDSIQGSFTDEEMRVWSTRALKVLVVACPCSLIIAVPATMISGISRAAKDGVLVKGAPFLERMAGIQMFCFDKTGTLTEGRFQVVEEHCVNEEEDEREK